MRAEIVRLILADKLRPMTNDIFPPLFSPPLSLSLTFMLNSHPLSLKPVLQACVIKNKSV